MSATYSAAPAARAKEKIDPNIFHQGQKINAFAAFMDDLNYRVANNRLQGFRDVFVVLGRESTARRLGYCTRTISRCVTRAVDLGYIRRAPRKIDPGNNRFGPMLLVVCRKLAILAHEKLRVLKLRGTRRSQYPSSLRRKRREGRRQGDKGWGQIDAERARKGFEALKIAVGDALGNPGRRRTV